MHRRRTSPSCASPNVGARRAARLDRHRRRPRTRCDPAFPRAARAACARCRGRCSARSRREVSDGRAVLRLARAPVDERMPVELVAHRGAHRAGAAAVDHAHARRARRATPRRRTRAPPRAPSCARCPRTSSSSETSLRASAFTFTAGSAALRRARDGRSRASAIRTRCPLEPDHLGLVAVDRGDRAAHADVGASTGSPAPSGASTGSGSSSVRSDRSAFAARSTPRRARDRPPAPTRAPPRRTQLRPQRRELVTRLGQLALRLGDRRGSRSRSADARTFSISACELPPRAPSAVRAQLARPRSARRPLPARPPRSRRAAPPIRSRSGATRSRASATTDASSPSRSAVCSACEMPGRPSVIR